MTTTEIRTAKGISNIWTPDGITWSWANNDGEGCGEASFEAAVAAAEMASAGTLAERSELLKERCKALDLGIVWGTTIGDSQLCAVMWRLYDEEGRNEVRYRPDLCDYRTVEDWLEEPDLKAAAR